MTGATSRRKGATAEVALANYLQRVGWPEAKRAIVTGYRNRYLDVADPGDIRGTPGIVWSVKNYAEAQVNKHISLWLDELDRMNGLGDQLGGVALLVVKRAGQADPARWWCYLRLHWLDALRGLDCDDCEEHAVRLELATVVELLAHAGYTRPLQETSA